jgi:POT family proton-dependent oligopeptide transporter
VTSPVESLPLYTGLFIKLGIVAVIGTVIAAALIPLMKKLSVVTEGPWEEAA